MPGLVPIYRIHFSKALPGSSETDWFVKGFAINEDLSLTETWKYTRTKGSFSGNREREFLFHSNFSTALSDWNSEKIVIMPVQAKIPYIQLIDGNLGTDRGRLPLGAPVHFSYPIVFGKSIIIPTSTAGLIIYEGRANFLLWLSKKIEFLREKFNSKNQISSEQEH